MSRRLNMADYVAMMRGAGYRACACGPLTRGTVCGKCVASGVSAAPPLPQAGVGAVGRGVDTPGDGDAKDGSLRPAAGHKEPNKTEAEYRRLFLAPRLADGVFTGCWFEGVSFRMANGHRYTPDWVCTYPDGRLVCVEVKGSYRFGSHQRARLAFDQARIEWPGVVWIWAVRGKGGVWETGG